MHAFLVTRWDGEPVNRAPEEHDDLRWFRRAELADLTMAHAGCLASALHALELAAAEPGWAAVRTPSQVPTRTVGDVSQA